jgi:hypothetical protein
VPIEEPPSFEDLRLLAAHMTREDRQALIRGEHATRGVFEVVTVSDEWNEAAVEIVQMGYDSATEAVRALKTFGEADAD